ncbi:hypothetical protein RZN22_17130 [Bacillaceae bacterium S4-13-58]
MNQPNQSEKELLIKLLHKVLLYRITRNIDKELNVRKISHSEISGSTGRNSNWFNRSFNELEDMKITTFVKILAAVNKNVDATTNSNFQPVSIESVLDKETLRIASYTIDVSINDLDYLITNSTNFREFLIEIRFYVVSLKALNNVLSSDELDAYEVIFKRIKA